MARRRSRLVGSRQSSARRIEGLAGMDRPVVNRVGPPWGGYVPDVSPSLASPSDFKDASGLVQKDGILGPHDGFSLLEVANSDQGYVDTTPDTSNYPLAVGNISNITEANPAVITVEAGHAHGLGTGDTVTIQNAAPLNNPAVNGTHVVTNVSATQFSVAIDNGPPAAGPATVGQWNGGPTAQGGTKPVLGLNEHVDNANLAIFQMATVGIGVAAGAGQHGHLYRYTGSPLYWDEVPYGPVLANSVAEGIAGEAQDHFDFAYHPLSDKIYFCNKIRRVYEYPTAGTYVTWAQGLHTTFTAKSVEAADDRLVFFNTLATGAGAGNWRRRVHWSNINAAPNLTGVGAGFIDLDEMEGEGLRVERIGDLLGCYATQGIALLRRTFLATSAFERFYVSHDRGVLSTFSVVNLGGGIHFIICTDGWYLMDQTGNFRELGLRTIGQRTYSKWRDAFYGELDQDNENRVYAVRHGPRDSNFISIAWPDVAAVNGLPNRVWVYDLQTDTLWPDNNYPGNDQVNVFGVFTDATTGQSWDNTLTTWDGTPGAWRDYLGSSGTERIVHGTEFGEVFRHSSAQYDKNNVAQSYYLLSHESDFGQLGPIKTGDRFRLEYVRSQRADGSNPLPVEVNIVGEENNLSQGGNIDQLKGPIGTGQSDYVDGKVPSQRLGYEISGQAPVFVRGGELSYIIQGVEGVANEQ